METQTPIQKSSLTPKFFFLSLGVLISLITSFSTFLVLMFETLDKKFPDILNSNYTAGYSSYDYDSIRATLATLIIFFPVFLILSYFWRKLAKNNLGVKDNVIFKWMIYLIIFLSSLVVIIDLVTLVRYFVSGEITIRFIYKVLGTAIITSLAGFNYFTELRNHDANNNEGKYSLVYAIVSFVLFFGLIIWSFVIIGSPVEQRLRRLDDKRITDLQNIQSQVITYWQQKEKLPTSLSDLENATSYFLVPIDPEFEKGNRYEYTPKENLSFDLCASFSTESEKNLQESNYKAAASVPVSKIDAPVAASNSTGVADFWKHGIGRTCFTRTIDKDIYPPIKK